MTQQKFSIILLNTIYVLMFIVENYRFMMNWSTLKAIHG